MDPGSFQPKEVKLLEHDRELAFARFSPCGKFVFAGSYDANVYRWNLETGQKVPFAGHSGWVQCVAFHPDGKQLFTGDSWGQLICWPDYAADAPAPRWTTKDAHSRWMRSLALSPDGSTLATCGADRHVRLWNAGEGSPKHDFGRQSDDLLCLQFHPDGRSLVVGDLKGVITHFDLTTNQPARQLDAKVLYLRPVVNKFVEINDVGGARALCFDAAGTTLAAGGSQPETSGFFTGKPTVVLIDWNAGTAKQTLQWEGVTPDEGIVYDLAWNPHQNFFMAASSGQPGKGALACWKADGAGPPAYLNREMFAHSRSSSAHADGNRIAVAQVSIKPGGATGNGRQLDANGQYVGLIGQVRVFETKPTPAQG